MARTARPTEKGDGAPPRPRDRDATRREIIAAAVAEFSEKGFAGGRVDEIAARTRTTKAMIYYYFGSKDALYAAVVEEVYGGIRSSMVRGDLLEVSAESYDRAFGVNTRGAFFLTQAVARRMVADGPEPDAPRLIIFVSSSNAVIVAPERGDDCMSKCAVSVAARLFAARLFAARLGEHGIAVHEVRPGLIRTDMTAASLGRYERLLAEGLTPINRWGTPEDVGRAVAALASGALPFTTGAAFPVDGGMHLHRL